MTTVNIIGNIKGGTGKTTSAVNVVAWFAELGKKTLLIDLDPQCNATDYFLDIEEVERTDRHITTMFEREDVKASDLVWATSSKNLDIIPATSYLHEVNESYLNVADYWLRLHDMLSQVKKRNEYEIIVVDTHPARDLCLYNALIAGDNLIIPLSAQRHPLHGCDQMWLALKRVRRFNRSIRVLGFVVTSYQEKRDSKRLEKIESYAKKIKPDPRNAGFDILAKIKKSDRYATSMEEQVPLAWSHPTEETSQNYRDLAISLLEFQTGRRAARSQKIPEVTRTPRVGASAR